MKPFKNVYSEQMKTNAGAGITEYDIAGLVTEAFKKVARYEIAEAVTYIPLDSNEPTNESEATNSIPNDIKVLTSIQRPEIAQNIPQEEVPATDSATRKVGNHATITSACYHFKITANFNQ